MIFLQASGASLCFNLGTKSTVRDNTYFCTNRIEYIFDLLKVCKKNEKICVEENLADIRVPFNINHFSRNWLKINKTSASVL